MRSISHKLFSDELFRPSANSTKLFLKFAPVNELLFRWPPKDIVEEFQLNGWFLMGEFTRRRILVTVFWTLSHPQYDHSLVSISKIAPSYSKHLLIGGYVNARLVGEGLMSLVIDAFGILSPGRRPF